MVKVEICNDLEKAKRLWHHHWPQDCFFDLWPVRASFQNQYHHTPYFLVAYRGHRFCGMLALSWIDEEQYFGHFPGELWQGKTWLEQNKIVAADQEAAHALLDHLPAGARIRYLCASDSLATGVLESVDEIGYLFFPPQYGYSFDAYWNAFARKSRKKIRNEMERLTAAGVTLRTNQLADIDWLFRQNLECFEDQSYFADIRFLKSFSNLAAWLRASNMLRVTTVLIGGRIAAVDMGAVWRGTYTVLAGATHPDFPGVAKWINLHHLKWACGQRINTVDFLCGEFNWKHRFHLAPRQLYQIRRPHILDTRFKTRRAEPSAACAV